MQVTREYEYIRGQIRFKVGVLNLSEGVITDIDINFKIPEALKWLMHEPDFDRSGNSLMIPKLRPAEKKSLTLYLEPISCMDGPIRATVSFADAHDQLHAIVMRQKHISITCPIFFTEAQANPARVRNLARELPINDKKILPIPPEASLRQVFNETVKTVGAHDIKLMLQTFSADNQYGEALFYGITKVKKEKMVIEVQVNGDQAAIELLISGKSEKAITALLAELEHQLRETFIQEGIISRDNPFYAIRTSVILGHCPYCFAEISTEARQHYAEGEEIKCQYCLKAILHQK